MDKTSKKKAEEQGSAYITTQKPTPPGIEPVWIEECNQDKASSFFQPQRLDTQSLRRAHSTRMHISRAKRRNLQPPTSKPYITTHSYFPKKRGQRSLPVCR